MNKDYFSQVAGHRAAGRKRRFCKLMIDGARRNVQRDSILAHGGITFSLADSALAFASNAVGACRVYRNIHPHVKPLHAGDIIIATAMGAIAYHRTVIIISKCNGIAGKIVALFKERYSGRKKNGGIALHNPTLARLWRVRLWQASGLHGEPELSTNLHSPEASECE